MQVPRATRAAIRRMHYMIGHNAISVIIHLRKGARRSKESIQAVGRFRCEDCTETQYEKQARKVATLSHYAFNHELLIDILEAKDFVE